MQWAVVRMNGECLSYVSIAMTKKKHEQENLQMTAVN